MKKKLDDANGLWEKELLSTLLAIRTTVHSGIRYTSFNLTFGVDVVIPIEIEINTLRTAYHDS